MTGERLPEELATTLAEMARALLAQDSLQDTLDRIVTYAVSVVDGCEGAGIMVIRNGKVHTLAASDDQARTSDRIQGELGEGPCFDAVRTGAESVLVTDMVTDASRWPRYGPRARELGVGSMLGFKLFTEQQDLGALNLYSSIAGALTERSEQMGWLLASHAAVAFSSARLDTDLHGAISTRRDIGVAMGILMERHGLSADEAFARLNTASQETNTKLREVARRVAETGESPSRA
jgi:transcriptional regulator with GAF, ATPase, and Fis domain